MKLDKLSDEGGMEAIVFFAPPLLGEYSQQLTNYIAEYYQEIINI